MCLVKLHKYPKITIFPKTVYKVIHVSSDGKFLTPYRAYSVELGKTYTGKFMWRRTFKNTIHTNFIEDGFIHAYTTIEDAITEKLSLGDISIRIVKCRIPAFTYYYIGKHNDIASRKLKYTNKIL